MRAPPLLALTLLSLMRSPAARGSLSPDAGVLDEHFQKMDAKNGGGGGGGAGFGSGFSQCPHLPSSGTGWAGERVLLPHRSLFGRLYPHQAIYARPLMLCWLVHIHVHSFCMRSLSLAFVA